MEQFDRYMTLRADKLLEGEITGEMFTAFALHTLLGTPETEAYTRQCVAEAEKAAPAAGVRLVCPFVDDIYRTAELIRGIPGIRIEAEKDYIREPKPNGYRSYHMVVTLPLRFLPAPPAEPVWLEVQLRTIAMDCWASIEHRVKYKREVPEQKLIVRELKRCADEIASTDLSLQTIRELIETLK